jgi:hypothetical protein
MQNTYSNRDFYLAAFLISEGYEILLHFRDQGFTTFVFRDNDKLREAVRKFHSLSATTEPVRYGHAIKSLKTLIHSEQISNTKSNNYNEHTQKGLN